MKHDLLMAGVNGSRLHERNSEEEKESCVKSEKQTKNNLCQS